MTFSPTEYKREWRAKNREAVRASHARYAYYARNAERISANVAQWQNADIRRKRAHAANTRAKRYGAVGRLDWRDLPALPAACSYCGSEATGFDHVIPFIEGGTNTLDNVVPCCRKCNERKNRYPAERLDAADA